MEIWDLIKEDVFYYIENINLVYIIPLLLFAYGITHKAPQFQWINKICKDSWISVCVFGVFLGFGFFIFNWQKHEDPFDYAAWLFQTYFFTMFIIHILISFLDKFINKIKRINSKSTPSN